MPSDKLFQNDNNIHFKSSLLVSISEKLVWPGVESSVGGNN